MLTDTHTHLYWDCLEKGINDITQKALQTGISTLINIGVDINTSKKALIQNQELSATTKLNLFSSIGIHPHEATAYADNPDVSIEKDMAQLEKIYLSGNNKIVAIGECGLDYLIRANDLHPEISLPDEKIKELQQQLFQAQIDLAKKLNLPLIIHSRDNRTQDAQSSKCWDQVIQMSKDHFGIYHCYSGFAATTNTILKDTSFFISFAGSITYPKNDYLKEAAKIIPLERIVLETDCPFLPPQSKRGQRNEPAFIVEIAQLIADIKQIPFEQVANQTTDNAKRIFRI